MVDVDSYPGQGTLHRERMKFERDFTQLPNRWMRDRRISRAARGLLAELMTHDAGYEVTLTALAASGTEGRDALRTMVVELEKVGYLHRVKKRVKGRFTGYTWLLQDPFEGVDNHGLTALDFPTTEKPTSVQPSTVRATTKEDQSKNKKSPVPAQPQSSVIRPVDNSRVAVWSDERCPANYRDGHHELGHYGKCLHCAERPLALRSAS